MWYKQEGEAVPFTCWPFMKRVNRLAKPYFRCHFNVWKIYSRPIEFETFLDIGGLNEVAEFVHTTYGTKEKIDKLYNLFEKHAQHLQKIYLSVYGEKMEEYADKKLIAFYYKLLKEYEKFWAHGLFIDGFDAGYDQREIAKIAAAYQLTLEEVGILTTPSELGFANERLVDFLAKLEKIADEKKVTELIAHPEMREHVKNFDWFQSTYGHRKPISDEQLCQDIITYKNAAKRKEAYEKLTAQEHLHTQKIHRILKQHGLKENPLYFFQKLTFFREQRKKYNLMGLYVLHRILEAVEKNKKIQKEHLNFLNYDEFEPIMNGLFDAKLLKKRFEEGVMITVSGKMYTEKVGKEARAEKEAIDAEILKAESKKELKGFVACTGKVTGKVRLVITRADFEKFKQGEILVTGMTRPEHVPLMKKAAAIVTNEGGITCHAAIVSRELGVPCIIGTKIATQVLKDGDVVEVDAEKGVIKKA